MVKKSTAHKKNKTQVLVVARKFISRGRDVTKHSKPRSSTSRSRKHTVKHRQDPSRLQKAEEADRFSEAPEGERG
ncbi:hypothetical protein NPIL_665171 [Nephila pilipes]|uniref:Uncharacterized protein n=1 Tax=Nephila pilipes TaxID=299642 RepID=A0A8X6TXU4_NEPPI|nr:hypothetical protein NPIL_665171 [Nephila pilipes]